MTSSRPYLVRAIYEWIVDNELTPYVVVDAETKDVSVPQQHVKDGQIVLNISPIAIHGLLINNQSIEFQARFSGRAHKIYAPVKAITAIYAKENGRGMVFGDEDDGDGAPEPDKPAGKPNLTLVKK